jgi:hypothetical protein
MAETVSKSLKKLRILELHHSNRRRLTIPITAPIAIVVGHVLEQIIHRDVIMICIVASNSSVVLADC